MFLKVFWIHIIPFWEKKFISKQNNILQTGANFWRKNSTNENNLFYYKTWVASNIVLTCVYCLFQAK